MSMHLSYRVQLVVSIWDKARPPRTYDRRPYDQEFGSQAISVALLQPSTKKN